MIFWKSRKGSISDYSVVMADCDCGCDDMIRIKKYTYTDTNIAPDYYISICGGKFYTEQVGIFKRILKRIKNSWRALIGKDYKLFEIMITPENIDELIRKLKDIRK